jgi:hypothetical protein
VVAEHAPLDLDVLAALVAIEAVVAATSVAARGRSSRPGWRPGWRCGKPAPMAEAGADGGARGGGRRALRQLRRAPRSRLPPPPTHGAAPSRTQRSADRRDNRRARRAASRARAVLALRSALRRTQASIYSRSCLAASATLRRTRRGSCSRHSRRQSGARPPACSSDCLLAGLRSRFAREVDVEVTVSGDAPAILTLHARIATRVTGSLPVTWKDAAGAASSQWMLDTLAAVRRARGRGRR